jgi:hypothetical protein
MKENFEIWGTFAKYSTIFEDSVVLKLLSINQHLQKEFKPKFDYQ